MICGPVVLVGVVPPPGVLPPGGTGGGLDPLAPSGMDAMFTIVPVLFVVVLVVAVVLAVRRGARYVQHGIDPTVADVDLQAKLLKSDLLAADRPGPEPADRSVTERLGELDRLIGAGTISPEEHAAARARVLGDI